MNHYLFLSRRDSLKYASRTENFTILTFQNPSQNLIDLIQGMSSSEISLEELPDSPRASPSRTRPPSSFSEIQSREKEKLLKRMRSSSKSNLAEEAEEISSRLSKKRKTDSPTKQSSVQSVDSSKTTKKSNTSLRPNSNPAPLLKSTSPSSSPGILALSQFVLTPAIEGILFTSHLLNSLTDWQRALQPHLNPLKCLFLLQPTCLPPKNVE